MKTKIFKTALLVFLSTLFILPVFSAKQSDFSKAFKKDFNINQGALLSINCEFTDIKAINWDKDIISVEVNITVDAKNDSQAQDKFEKVNIDVQGNTSKVTIITSLKNSYFGNSNNNNIDIEVLIYYPEHIQLELDNEFGSSIFENISGSVNAEVAYGNFIADQLTSTELDLDAEFGKIEVNRFQGGSVEVAYGGFTAEVAGILKLDSEFSSNDIDQVERLELESAYDKIYLGQVNTALIEQEFSSLRIDKLKKQLLLETAYGSFKLNEIAPNFEMIIIESEFTGITLRFAKDPSFAFKVAAEMGDFNYPKELAKITMLEKEMFKLSLEGYFGNAKGENPKLVLDIENASANIKVNE